MKKQILIALMLSAIGYAGVANAENVKDKKYYREHIDEAKALAKNCTSPKPEKGQLLPPDNCSNAKSVVWTDAHTYKPAATNPTKTAAEKK